MTDEIENLKKEIADLKRKLATSELRLFWTKKFNRTLRRQFDELAERWIEENAPPVEERDGDLCAD